MKIAKTENGIPFYVCEAPQVEYRDFWHWDLIKEIEGFCSEQYRGEVLLRGIKEPDLEGVAEIGSDRIGYPLRIGDLTYVTTSSDYSYAFSVAGTGIIIYDNKGLEEFVGDPKKDWDELSFNRFMFIKDPREALKGIIDVREMRRLSRKMKNFEFPKATRA
ncbi:MAG: hypothetical protein AABX51_03765 [Nanoarchaeota archaeon]